MSLGPYGGRPRSTTCSTPNCSTATPTPPGQFTVPEHIDAVAAAGLDVTYDPDGLMGRGLHIVVEANPEDE